MDFTLKDDKKKKSDFAAVIILIRDTNKGILKWRMDFDSDLISKFYTIVNISTKKKIKVNLSYYHTHRELTRLDFIYGSSTIRKIENSIYIETLYKSIKNSEK